MRRDEIFEGVKDVLEESLGVAPEAITPTASLSADLGADSLDVMDIVVRLNRRFSLKMSAKELGDQLREGQITNPAKEGDAAFSSNESVVNGNGIPEGQLERSRKTADLITVDFLVNAVDSYMRAEMQQPA